MWWVGGFFCLFLNNNKKALAYKGSDIKTILKRIGSFEVLMGRYFDTSTRDLGFSIFNLLPEK